MVAIFAHRGARRSAPENTEEAFQLAVELGADGIELDVRLTVDRVAIVHHDPTLTDGRVISDIPFRELPHSIPSLQAALDACGGSVTVNVEIKNSPHEQSFDSEFEVVRRVVDELDIRADDGGRWLVSSFNLATLNEFHRLRPEIRSAFLTAGEPESGLETAIEHEHCVWHPWWQDVSADLVAAAHDHGITVNVWTCNEPEHIERMIGWGVDGIITDVPDVALSVRDQVR